MIRRIMNLYSLCTVLSSAKYCFALYVDSLSLSLSLIKSNFFFCHSEPGPLSRGPGRFSLRINNKSGKKKNKPP